MTLRLRLTLFYTLLVALILGFSGASLHALLRRELIAAVDEGLAETFVLLSAEPQPDAASTLVAPQGVDELIAVLYSAAGAVTHRLGAVPAGLPPLHSGYVTWSDWRVLTRPRPFGGGTLAVLQDLDDVHASLRRFDSLVLLLAPVAVGVAFGLGYALAGGALAPVRHLTQATHELARRRAWRERLPEPQRRDELWRLAQGTNQLLGALETVIENERRFTADAAHELRTPLTVLQGRIEEAIEEAHDPVQVHRLLGKAQQANAKLLGVVQKLLALARTEAGQGLTPTQVALDDIAFDVAAQLRPAFETAGLELVVELPEEAVYVSGDHTALELAARNLLDNALKFTAAGAVRLRVGVAEDSAYLEISDTGPGLSAEALPYVFERFYQAEVTHRQRGSGLGLALVRSVATWHGGNVAAENLPGGGARFTLTLPR